MLDIKVFAHNVKTYRKSLMLSQIEFADKMAVSPQAVSKWERGESLPDVENICAMAKAFGVSVDALLGVEGTCKTIMLGIDGGGSKTEFVSFDTSGTIYSRLVLGASNPNSVGADGSLAVLRRGINEMLSLTPSIEAIFIGCAGFSLGENVQQIKASLAKDYPHIKIKCSTDVLNVIASTTDEERCIAVICGTGSSVFAKNGDELTRLTGWGYLLSDKGSGYCIGKDGIRACLAEIDGLGEKTLITDLVKVRAGQTVSEIVGKIHKGDQTYMASFAKDVFEALHSGDEVARRIVEDNAKSLAEIINHAHIYHGKSTKVIASGSIFTKTEEFARQVKKYLLPQLQLVTPSAPQVLGACKLSAKILGEKWEITDEIIRRYNEKVENQNA